MKSNPGSFISGLLIGMVAGSVIALLTAPSSGTETRHMIGDQAQRIRDKAGETVSNVADKAGEKIEKLQERGSEVVNAQKDRINRVIKDRGGEEIA